MAGEKTLLTDKERSLLGTVAVRLREGRPGLSPGDADREASLVLLEARGVRAGTVSRRGVSMSKSEESTRGAPRAED